MSVVDIVIGKAKTSPYIRNFDVVNSNGTMTNITYNGYRWVIPKETYRAVIRQTSIVDGYPLVNLLNHDRELVVNFIANALRYVNKEKELTVSDKENYRQAYQLVDSPPFRDYVKTYDNKKDGLPCNLFTWLCHEADLHHRGKPTTITTMKSDILTSFLERWYNSHNLRLLYNYGLTRKEIKKMNLPILTIYQRLTHYPYAISLFSYEQCNNIVDMNGLFNPISNLEWHQQWGLLIRELHQWCDRGYYRVHVNRLSRFAPLLDEPSYSMFHSIYFIERIGDYVYLASSYEREQQIINRIVSFSNPRDPFEDLIPKEKVLQLLDDHHYDCYDSASVDQQAAIKGALYDRVSIISGAAGTGKSRCLLGLIKILTSIGRRPLVVAPTGIASVRLRSEADPVMVSTIHSAIRYRQKPVPSSLPPLNPSSLPPLGQLGASVEAKVNAKAREIDIIDYYNGNFDHLIVDEMGMVSLELLHRLVTSYPELKYMTLVGDPYQLQPIKAAPLFPSLIDSKVIPHYSLYINHRNELPDHSENYITTNAERILNDFMPLLKADNFQLIESITLDSVIELEKVAIENNIPCRDIIVLCPFNEPLIEINRQLRLLWNGHNVLPESTNPSVLVSNFLVQCGNIPKPENNLPAINRLWDELSPRLPTNLYDSWNNHWAIGDRVKMTVNNRTSDIYNGDEGFITKWDWSIIDNAVRFGCIVTVRKHNNVFFSFSSPRFDEQRSKHSDEPDQEDMYNNECITYRLKYNYGSTIHSCQGAEYPFVIVYIPPGTQPNPSFLNRQMLYTMITRAKESCWIIGDQAIINTISSFVDHSDRIHTGALLQNHLPFVTSTSDEYVDLSGIDF